MLLPAGKSEMCDFCAEYDFDSPNAFDHEALVQCMQDLRVRPPCLLPRVVPVRLGFEFRGI